MWRGLPHSVAARRAPKTTTSAVIPIDWDPAGDANAQDAALRAAERVKALRPPEAAAAEKEEVARRAPAAKGEATRQSAAREAASREEARKRQVAAARQLAYRSATKAEVEQHAGREQPLQLARASLAASERCRRLASQPSRIGMNREAPSEAGRQLLAALGVNENYATNTRPGRDARRQPTVGGIRSSRTLRTRPECKKEIPSSCHRSRTPWLGIGFDDVSPFVGDEHGLELSTQAEPPSSQEREPICGGDTHQARLQALQAELERVRHLEALLQSERAKEAFEDEAVEVE